MKIQQHLLKITFWNEDNDLTKEIEIWTSYPTYEDVEEYLYMNNMDDFKSNGGLFDFFELSLTQ